MANDDTTQPDNFEPEADRNAAEPNAELTPGAGSPSAADEADAVSDGFDHKTSDGAASEAAESEGAVPAPNEPETATSTGDTQPTDAESGAGEVPDTETADDVDPASAPEAPAATSDDEAVSADTDASSADAADDAPATEAVGEDAASIKEEPEAEDAVADDTAEASDTPEDLGNTGDDPQDGSIAAGATEPTSSGLLGRVPVMSVLIGLNTILLAALLVWLLGGGSGDQPPVTTVPQRAAAADDKRPDPEVVQAGGAQVDPDAVTLTTAEAARRDENVPLALASYRHLLANAGSNARDELVADYFRLRIAQCLAALKRSRQAHTMLSRAMGSRSPVVRGVAYFDSALLNLNEGQYLRARMHAYRALGSLAAVPGSESLRAEADFIVAKATSKKALQLYNQSKELPDVLLADLDPFRGIRGEEGLRSILGAGVDTFLEAALTPQLKMTRTQGLGKRWTVTAAGAPIDDFLVRMAGHAEVDVVWATDTEGVRQRAVLMHVEGVPSPRVIEIACGSAGLMARLTGDEVRIHDPTNYASTGELRDLTVEEAISCWRRFFLRVDEPIHVAYGHFAVGTMYLVRDETAEAMNEFQLLTQRYPNSPFAPKALLRGAIARTRLQDFIGARDQLLTLLNRHPNFPQTDQVYLHLGQATMKAGLHDEAIETFTRLYYQELSLSSRLGACVGNGESYLAKGDPKSAVEWLSRYRNITQVETGDELARACLLLGRAKAEMGELEAAEEALASGASARPSPRIERRITLELSKVLADREQYTHAIGLLQHLKSGQDIPVDTVDKAVLAEARILRRINLAERGMRVLQHRLKTVTDPATATRMALELAECYADARDLNGARTVLSEIVSQAEAGPLAREAACRLAEVCLEAGQAGQAIVVCRKLLGREVAGDLRRRTFKVLGSAYLKQRDYERAALAFGGTMPTERGETRP